LSRFILELHKLVLKWNETNSKFGAPYPFLTPLIHGVYQIFLTVVSVIADAWANMQPVWNVAMKSYQYSSSMQIRKCSVCSRIL